jgi:hypothetical protein
MRTTWRVTSRLEPTRPGTLARRHPSAVGKWVGAVGVSGFLVAGVVTATVGALIFLRGRALARTAAAREWPQRPGQPGSVVPHSLD